MFLEVGEGNVDESTKNLNQEHIFAESALSYQIASHTLTTSWGYYFPVIDD